MGSLVSGLPPVVTTQDPPRSFLHEIAFKKVHDAALTCLEQLAYFFVQVFCCFYSSYDKFYAEELAKKNAPPAPPNGGTPAAAETPEAPERVTAQSTYRQDELDLHIYRPGELDLAMFNKLYGISGDEGAVSAPQRTTVRALSPARSEPDLEIAQRVGELSVEALSPTSKKPTVDSPREPRTMVDESVAPLVPLPLVKDPAPTTTSNDVSPVQAVAEPTKETESAPARSASPSRALPVLTQKQFRDLTGCSHAVELDSDGECLKRTNIMTGDSYPILFCQEIRRGNWCTTTYPPIELGGQIAVEDGNFQYLHQYKIKMHKSDGSLEELFYLDGEQLYQETTGEKRYVYLARTCLDLSATPPNLKKVDAPESRSAAPLRSASPTREESLVKDPVPTAASNDVSPVQAVPEPKITKLALRGELWDYTRKEIAGLIINEDAPEYKGQYLTLLSHKVMFGGIEVLDRQEYCKLDTWEKIIVKECTDNPEKIEIQVPFRGTLTVDLTKPYTRFCMINPQSLGEKVYITDKARVVNDYYLKPDFYPVQAVLALTTVSNDVHREESSESENEEETPTVAAPVTVTPVVEEKPKGYKFKDHMFGLVKMGWSGEYLTNQSLVNQKSYMILFCQKQSSGWYTATHPDLELGGEITVKSGFQDTIEMRKIDGSLQSTFVLDRLQLYQETTGEKRYVFLARLKKDGGSIPTGLKKVDAPERTTFDW